MEKSDFNRFGSNSPQQVAGKFITTVKKHKYKYGISHRWKYWFGTKKKSNNNGSYRLVCI